MTGRLTTNGSIWLTGASSGIGEALAMALLESGQRLIVTGRRQEPLDELASRAPERVVTATADTTSREDLDRVAGILQAQEPVTMAILNAGTCEYLDVAHYDSSVVEQNITTNVIGTSRCIERVLPLLRNARSRGLPATLVIVGSSAWWFPFGRAEGYGASKAALAYLAESLRADLAPEGIDVVLVSPGFVKTPLTDRNDFPMPFRISASDAAQRIIRGLERSRNRIEFPRRFTWTLRLLSALPGALVDRMAASMVRSSNESKEDRE